MAAVYFGIGQVIDFLGRATHRSEQIGSLLAEEILPQLRAMDTRLDRPAHAATPSADEV
jgi:hypothetical protein